MSANRHIHDFVIIHCSVTAAGLPLIDELKQYSSATTEKDALEIAMKFVKDRLDAEGVHMIPAAIRYSFCTTGRFELQGEEENRWAVIIFEPHILDK